MPGHVDHHYQFVGSLTADHSTNASRSVRESDSQIEPRMVVDDLLVDQVVGTNRWLRLIISDRFKRDFVRFLLRGKSCMLKSRSLKHIPLDPLYWMMYKKNQRTFFGKLVNGYNRSVCLFNVLGKNWIQINQNLAFLLRIDGRSRVYVRVNKLRHWWRRWLVANIPLYFVLHYVRCMSDKLERIPIKKLPMMIVMFSDCETLAIEAHVW